MLQMTRYIQPQAQSAAVPPPALSPPPLIILVLYICLPHPARTSTHSSSSPTPLVPTNSNSGQRPTEPKLSSRRAGELLLPVALTGPTPPPVHPQSGMLRLSIDSLGDGLDSAGCEGKGNVFCARCWCGCMPLGACTRGHFLSSTRNSTCDQRRAVDGFHTNRKQDLSPAVPAGQTLKRNCRRGTLPL